MPHIPNMKEKTLRYPIHVEFVIALKQAGFFDEKEIEIDGVKISPLRFCSKILFQRLATWHRRRRTDGNEVIIEGEKDKHQNGSNLTCSIILTPKQKHLL
jgi:saccharopine dehydrogenase-like NADP-dependent oxidoreductase